MCCVRVGDAWASSTRARERAASRPPRLGHTRLRTPWVLVSSPPTPRSSFKDWAVDAVAAPRRLRCVSGAAAAQVGTHSRTRRLKRWESAPRQGGKCPPRDAWGSKHADAAAGRRRALTLALRATAAAQQQPHAHSASPRAPPLLPRAAISRGASWMDGRGDARQPPGRRGLGRLRPTASVPACRSSTIFLRPRRGGGLQREAAGRGTDGRGRMCD